MMLGRKLLNYKNLEMKVVISRKNKINGLEKKPVFSLKIPKQILDRFKKIQII